MNDKELIEEIYREYWRRMIEKDAKGLRALMTDSYELRHMTGVRQSAEEFLRGLEDGTFNYYSAEHESIAVTVEGDCAKMVGKSLVLASVYGGGRRMWRLRGDFTLEKINGTWKMTGSAASTW